MAEADGAELAARLVAWRKSRHSAAGDRAACLQFTTATGHPDGSVTKDVNGVTVVLRPATKLAPEPAVEAPEAVPPLFATEVLPPPPAPTALPARQRPANGWTESPIQAFLDAPRPDRSASADRAPETTPETVADAPSTVRPPAAVEEAGRPDDAAAAPAETVAEPAVPREWLASSVDVPAVPLATERFDPAYEPPGTVGELDENAARAQVRDRVVNGRLTLVRANVRKVQAASGQGVREFTLALPVLAGDLPLGDVTDFQARLQSLLDAHLNRGYALSRSREQLHVWVALTPVHDHGEAIVLSSSDRPGPADQLHLDLNHDDGDLLHELLHYLGVRDEGRSAWSLYRRTPDSRSVHTTGVMADTGHDTAAQWVPQRYLTQIEDVSDAASVIPERPLPGQARPSGSVDENADVLSLLPETALRLVGETDAQLTHLPSAAPQATTVDWTIVRDWLRESAGGGASRSDALRDLDTAVRRLNGDRGNVAALQAVLYAIDEWRTSKVKPSRRDAVVDRLEAVVDAELGRHQVAGGGNAAAGSRPVRDPEQTMALLGELEGKYFPDDLQLGTPHLADTVVTPHVDGDTFFGAIAEVMDSLRGPGDRLYITSWYFHQATRLRHGRGEPKLVDRLVDLVTAGVDVRIIVAIPRHSLSPFEKPAPQLDFWRWPVANAVGQFSETNINSVRALRGKEVDGRAVLADRVLIDWGGAMDSRHEKSTIAYNATTGELHAFVGGMDYAPNRFAGGGHTGAPKYNYWHDVGVQLQGGAGVEVLRNFWTRWDETSTLPDRTYWYDKTQERYNPTVVPDPDLRVPEHVRTPSGSNADAGVRIWRSYGPQRVSPLTDSLRLPWRTLPPEGVAEFSNGIVAAINAAERYVYVEDQTLNPSLVARAYNHHRVIFPAIARALARGVKVLFVTQGFPGRGSPSADATPDVSTEINALILDDLSPAQRQNFALFFLQETKIHSKLVLIDDEFASIGSANFWDRSAEGDESEVTAAIVHPGDSSSLVADLRVQLWREHLRVPETAASDARLRDLDVSLGYFRSGWGTGTASDIPQSALVESRPGLVSRVRGAVAGNTSGGAASVNPEGSRLPLGAPVVVDVFAPGTPEYAQRHGGQLDARVVREVPAVPDVRTGGKAKEPTFTRRLLSGPSSPWVSYSVVDTADSGTEIVLPGGERIPGEGWFRHGPLFLHAGDPQGEIEEPGWVLYGDTGWIGRLANGENLFPGTTDVRAGDAEAGRLILTGRDADEALAGGFSPATAPGYRIVPTPAGVYLAPVGAEGPVVHLPWEETITAGGTGGGRPGFGLGGVPAGIGWAHARWVQSWGLRFDPAGVGSLYAAVLAASGGSVTVDGRVLRDPDEVRQVLSDRMRDAPVADVRRWPAAVEAYLAAAAARLASASVDGRLSPEQQRQIEAQIDNGQAWLQMVASLGRPGHWDELADLVAPLMITEYLGTSLLVLHADGRMSSFGSGTPLVIAQTTRSDGVPWWAGVPAAVAGPVLDGLSGAQVRWAADAGMRFVGPRGGGDFLEALMAAGLASGTVPPLDDPNALRSDLARRMQADTQLAGSEDWAAISAEYLRGSQRGLDDGEVLQEIIAAVRQPGRAGALTGGIWPLLVHRYRGVPVHVLEAGGQVRSYGEGPGITVADGDGRSWVGLAPVTAPRALGAGTRPADVAGGWSAPAPVEEFADASAPAGPAGLSAAQRQWALRQHRRFVEVPAGVDGFFDAVLQAADGGFSAGEVFVNDATRLRGVLVDKIREIAGTDLGLWLVVHTIYAAQYRAARQAERGVGPVTEDEARVWTAQIDERIDDGQALEDIVNAIAAPDYWPELAEEVAPYFLNQFGLAVRTVDAVGVVGRYGRGRPVYVAPVPGDEPRRWVALPPVATRYATGSRLGAPNRSDPVLVRLAQAVDARRTTATDVPADGTDPVAGWLRDVRKRWPANGQQVPPAGGTVQWDRDWLADTVAGLGSAAGLSQVAGLDAVDAGVSLALAVELTEALFERGGIRPAPDAAVGQAGPPAGIPAEQWVGAPSLREVIGAVPFGGAALFLLDRRAWVVVDTTSGLRLVEFGPDAPAVGRVSAPTPAAIASMDWPGLALVIGSDGQVVPAERLDGSFTPATGWHAEASVPSSPEEADAVSSVSAPQDVWTREHAARLVEARPGANSFFDAVITAAGGRLTVSGEEVTDAVRLRQVLATQLRDMAASGGLRTWPLISAAFAFEAEERIVEEFLGNDLTRLDRGAVHRQIDEHFESGAAARYIEQAIAQPGHWEQITQLLAPELLAESAGLNLLILDPDGQVRGTGDPDGRQLVLAHTGAGPEALPGWAAVVPQTPEQESFGDIGIDGRSRLAERVSAGEAALINDSQRQRAEDQGLRVEPTAVGADSFFSAILAAAGGGVLLDRTTFVDTPAGLRQALAGLLRERPDVLDAAAWQQIEQILDEEDLDTEKIADVLTDPADQHTDRFAQHLVGPYLGIELRVIEADGATSTHGTGRALTIAPTIDQQGGTHWAALVPTAPQEPVPHTQPAGLPGLPELPALPKLPDLDQPSITTRWDPDYYKNLPPGAAGIDDPWRNSTFCVENEDGVLTCVSVAVVTLDRTGSLTAV